MKRRNVDELKQELQDLMREHLDDLTTRQFVQASKERLGKEEERLVRIREVSADYLAAVKRDMLRQEVKGESMPDKSSVTLPGKVEKIIEPAEPSEPEKAQIALDDADPLYRELRIENTLTDSDGKEVRLKENADVHVTVEADKEATTPNRQKNDQSK